jgi:hypothetical protein
MCGTMAAREQAHVNLTKGRWQKDKDDFLVGSKSNGEDKEKEREYDLTVMIKKTKLKASSLLLVTYIQIHTGFEAQL